MDWVLENKEWVFSGIGVLFVSFIVTLFSKNRKNNSVQQEIKSGKNSKNIQSSGNVTIHIGQRNEE